MTAPSLLHLSTWCAERAYPIIAYGSSAPHPAWPLLDVAVRSRWLDYTLRLLQNPADAPSQTLPYMAFDMAVAALVALYEVPKPWAAEDVADVMALPVEDVYTAMAGRWKPTSITALATERVVLHLLKLGAQ